MACFCKKLDDDKFDIECFSGEKVLVKYWRKESFQTLFELNEIYTEVNVIEASLTELRTIRKVLRNEFFSLKNLTKIFFSV